MTEQRGPYRVKVARVDKVFAFIVAYKQEHDGNAPALREIGESCGISSTSAVNFCLDKLEKRGLIRRPGNAARSIEIVGGYGSVKL